MSLAREEEDIEALVRTDQGVDYPDGIRRMNIVVHIARAEQQMALQIPCQLRIGLDVVNEGRVPVLDFLLYAVMLLAPPSVVDAVVVVAGAGNRCLEEIRIGQYRGRGHEASAGMPVDAHPVEVNPGIPGPELLDCIFLVLQTIVAEIAVAIVVIPFRPVRMASAVAHGDHDEAELGQPVRAGHSAAPLDGVGLHLRPRIHVVAYRIHLCRIEIVRLVNGSVQVCYTVGGLDREPLRELVSGCEEEGEVGFPEGGYPSSGGVVQC